jgi:hypothetical protein
MAIEAEDVDHESDEPRRAEFQRMFADAHLRRFDPSSSIGDQRIICATRDFAGLRNDRSLIGSSSVAGHQNDR